MDDSSPTLAAAAPTMRSTGERYRVLATIGVGSSAAALKVHDLELDEIVVLKVLAPAVASDPQVIDRLKREIRIARRVRHPNVARVYDLEEWEGRLCISMEYIEGETLDRRIAQGPMPWEDAVGLLTTLALALESAHQLGVVHRDLKPPNVILDRRGNPYILDFGVATARDVEESSQTEVIRGTPNYMAPERWRGVGGLPESDLYSLGVLAWEILAGHPPFRGSSVRMIMAQHLHSEVPDIATVVPGVPAELAGLVMRLLEKRPEQRPANATQVIRVLRKIAPGRRGAVAPPPGGRGRVLVVEDESHVRALLAEVLRSRGVTVYEASNGYEGVEIAEQVRPDIVFLDIGMPGLDGVETLRSLKSNPVVAGRPMVMLSGSVDPQHPILSRRLGAVAFLNKPVNPDVLDLVLDKYLG